MLNRLQLQALTEHSKKSPLAAWTNTLQEQIRTKLAQGHGDLARWQRALDRLPALPVTHSNFAESFSVQGACSAAEQRQLEQALKELIPWRKGPFDLFGIQVDSEWRSDQKWARLAPHLDLAGKDILDVGSANGYYLWRMLDAGAACALGVDPNWLFLCQFLACKHYVPEAPAWQLPLALEDLPLNLNSFDQVFSMGVLYHRRAPIDHLLHLKGCLKPNGTLVLETLVVPGDAQQVLVPEGRYAMMNNVWFLPSVAALELWLKRAGFIDIHCIDCTQTSITEQRKTDWMRFQSLSDFLDPKDPKRTCEGLPAPLRAILLARKP